MRNREVRCLRSLSFVSIAAAAAVLAGCGKQPQAAPGPAAAMMMMVVPVRVATVQQQSVPTVLRVVGTVEASAIVQVKSQIAGQIERVAFPEGQNVKEGDLLFVIDPRPYQDALRQAEAAVARDQAQIAQSEATLARDTAQAKFAESDAARHEQMAKEGVGSKEQFDQFRANADVARESAKATEAIDRQRARRARRGPGGGGGGPAQPELLRNPRAHFRPHRQPAGARRQPGQGERRGAGGDPPGRAHLRELQRAGAAPGGHPPAQRGRPAGGARGHPRQPRPVRAGTAGGDRQHGRFHHRHHPPEGQFRECQRHAVAGPVRQRGVDARYRFATPPWCPPKRCRADSRASSSTW